MFRAGQGRDNIISNEDVVITDTMVQVRKTLNKEKDKGVSPLTSDRK